MSVDWELYQKCPVCFAELGEPCARTRWVVAGVAEVFEEADEPHSPRKLRAAAARAGGDR